jgi:hypothetical protein
MLGSSPPSHLNTGLRALDDDEADTLEDETGLGIGKGGHELEIGSPVSTHLGVRFLLF